MALVNVILITKYRYKKTSLDQNSPKMGGKCELIHILSFAVCCIFVMQIAKYFHLHLLGCDLQQVLPPDIFIAKESNFSPEKIFILWYGENPKLQLCSKHQPGCMRLPA